MIPILLVLLAVGCRKSGQTLEIGGGPTGGTFQNIATGLAQVINQEMTGYRAVATRSGGSGSNLRDVDRGKLSMALAYAGDAYLGRRGELGSGEPATENVRAVARLYGAAAQLMVLQESPFRTPSDLKGRRIAIGNPGSGSALAAQRYFRSLGIWEEIIPIHVGFDMGLAKMSQGSADAVWLVVGFPNISLLKFSREKPVRFLDLLDGGNAGEFFRRYPFYSAVRITADTYPDQKHDVSTFQDAVLWVANRQLDEKFVQQALRLLFSAKGLSSMRAEDPAAGELSEAKGLTGVTIPLHPGAERFWRERGVRELGRD